MRASGSENHVALAMSHLMGYVPQPSCSGRGKMVRFVQQLLITAIAAVLTFWSSGKQGMSATPEFVIFFS